MKHLTIGDYKFRFVIEDQLIGQDEVVSVRDGLEFVVAARREPSTDEAIEWAGRVLNEWHEYNNKKLLIKDGNPSL